MTGYGRGSAENKVAVIEVELRSVNGKGLSVKLRLPGDRMELEPVLEARARKQLERGSLQGTVRVRLKVPQPATLDQQVLRGYLRQWRSAEKTLGLAPHDPSLAELLALPGAVESMPETATTSKTVERAVVTAFDEALEALRAAREKEGQRLRKELLRLLTQIERDLKRTLQRVPAAHRAGAERFRQRVQQSLEAAGLTDSIDLTRELAVLAERADVSEETARLAIHLQRLRAMLDLGGPCGREVEFLIQECHREITTLGNKSADADLSECVIAMKAGAQRMREQAANVE